MYLPPSVCIMALCSWSVFGFIIGLFVSLMILGAKDFFYKDYATKLGE